MDKDQARLGIVLIAREKHVVISVAGLFDHNAEGVVVVGRGAGADRRPSDPSFRADPGLASALAYR